MFHQQNAMTPFSENEMRYDVEWNYAYTVLTIFIATHGKEEVKSLKNLSFIGFK